MEIEHFSSKKSSMQLSTFTATKAKLCLPLESAKQMTQWSAFYFTHSTSYYPVPSSQIRMQDFPTMKQQNHPYTHSNDQGLIRKWANDHGKCVRQRTVRGKKPLSSRLEPFPWTCMRLLCMEESDWILRKMKTVKCHKKMKEKVDIWNFSNRPALSIPWRLLWWQWFCIRRRWCRASTSKQRTRFLFHSTKNQKRENGEDIEQGSSLVIVLNQSKKNWVSKNVVFLVKREMPNLLSVKCETAILLSTKRDQYPPALYHPPRTVTCEWSGQCFQVCLFVYLFR